MDQVTNEREDREVLVNSEEQTGSAKQVAAECLLEAAGVFENAKWLLKAKILNTAELRAEYLDPYLESLCDRLLSECRSRMRAVVITPAARGSMGLVALARSWYDWPLRSGVKLGDATLEELKSEEEFYRSLTRTYDARRKFFHALAAECGAGKVREVLSTSGIEALAAKCGVKKETDE